MPASLAASLLLVAIGTGIAMRMRDVHLHTIRQESPEFVRAVVLSDPAYRSHRDELLRQLPAKLERLPAESGKQVRDSLEAVQLALRSLEAELGRDGGNAVLQELLVSTYQEEIRVLTVVDEIGGFNPEI